MGSELINTGINVIGPVPWGTHFCEFYQTRDDLLDTVVPYFAAGLERNEFCMWIASEPLTAAEARRAMRRAVPDFADRVARGQMEILPHNRWYLRGGAFDRQRVLDGWVKKLEAALAAGYAGLRLSGNTFWLEKRDWETFTEYEAAINEVIGRYRMLALCTYSLDRCGAAEVMDVIRNHQFALIRKDGNWELVESAMQQRARQALADSESRYRGLYHAVAGGIVVQDRMGLITESNALAREILGLTVDEITGRTSANPEWQAVREDGSLFPGGEHPAMVTLRTGKPVQGVVMGVLHPTSGRRRWILINSEPVLHPQTGQVEAATTTFLDITQQKQEEQALRETRDYLDSLLNYANAPIIVWDRDFRITRFNMAFQKLTGYTESEVVGGPLDVLFPEQTRGDSLAHIERAAAGERWEVVEIPIRRKDGTVRTVLWNSATIHDRDGGTAVATIAQGQDITERKQAEEKLAFQADTLSYISDAVVATDNDGRVTYWNRMAEEAYGVPAGQAIGRHLADLYQVTWLKPDDERDWAQEMASSGRWNGDSIHIKKSGERAYVRSSMGVMRRADGARTGTVMVIRDRTKLWQAEQELKLLNERLRQQSEDRLRATDASFRRAIAGNADGLVVIRKDGVIRFANAAAELLFGRAVGQMEGTLFRFPLTEGAEIEIPRGDGQSAVAEMRIVELEWEGAPAYLATLRDVTKRKQGLLALQESETRLRLLLEQIPCVSWTVDTRLRITSYSGTGLGFFRNVPSGIMGMSLSEYFEIDDPEFMPYAAHQRALQGAPASYELGWGGRTFIGRVEPLRDADDRIVGVVGVAFDITDRKLAEEQLRGLSHRLVTAQENERRRIARELHDEVGQLLTALKLCLDKAASSEPARDGSELQEARVALRELMARVRSMSLELRPTMLDDLGLLPTLLWHFKRYTAQTKVQVRFKHRGLRQDLPQEVVTAAYRIVQEALTNVARYAQVGSVSVRVRAEPDALLVEVEDRGVGFDVESVAPTRTGLNGMRERALSLKGKLLVQSKPGEGTCIIAELPLVKKRAGRRRGKGSDNRSPG